MRSELRWCFVVCLLVSSSAFGAIPVSTIDTFDFPSDELRDRYQGLIAELRCPQCQNTNLAGSDAMIAKDLRNTVYRLVVVEKQSDQMVRDYLRDRYGEFVLYDPPFRPSTWLLWFAPVLALLGGALVILRMVRRSSTPAELDDAERERLKNLLTDSR